MGLRVGVAVVGRLFVGVGIVVLLFIVYQLFGTNLRAALTQQALSQQFSQELRHSPVTTLPKDTATVGPANATGRAAADASTPEGDPLGIISIPSINVDKVVVQGVGEPDLQKGPGHYPGTPLPGQPGNAAIAGHRTTWGAPFYRLNQIRTGAPIYVQTRQGRFTYRVIRSFVVDPSDVGVIAGTKANLLTLSTCTPLYSAAQRLIVQASLVGQPIAMSKVVLPAAVTTGGAGRTLSTHLAGHGGGWWPALLWGMALVVAATAMWLVRRRLGRRGWLTYLAGAPILLALLFMFFGGLNTLLPASI